MRILRSVFSAISVGFLPVMAAVIIAYGLVRKAPVYDYFIDGAKEGLKTAVDILPFMIGIYLAVNGLTASGLINFIYLAFRPLFSLLGVPVELLPLMFLRAISGSGSFIIVQDILEIVNPDSYTGRVACVMTGGCETVIYVLALYFGVTRVKKLRHALASGLVGYFTGIVVSLISCNYI